MPTPADPTLPPGHAVRAVAYGPDGTVSDADLDVVTAVVHRSEQRVLGGPDTTRAEVQEMLTTPDVVRSESYVVQAAGRVVAGGWIEADAASRELWCETYVDPGHADAERLRAALVERAMARGRAVVGDREGWRLRAGAYEAEADYRTALTERGYTLLRRFWRMEIASDSPDVPAVMPDLPPGVTIDTGEDDAHRRALYEVDQVAFLDHWNFAPRSYDEVWERVRAEAGARGEYWWLLRVAGDPAGLCMLNESRLDAGELYVANLGILPDYRRRGLARLLLQRAFVTARDAGLAGASLHVDAASPTGATRLYQSVGMRAALVIDSFELAV